MSRRVTHAAGVFLIIFAGAQLVRPARSNPVVDPVRTIHARGAIGSGAAPVFDRACGDCHSNATAWPWYTRVAPLSWLMAYGVNKGRRAVNFSEWSSYSPELQRTLLSVSCQDVSSGKMPGRPYALLHPETRLSDRDVQAICAAARQAEAGIVQR